MRLQKYKTSLHSNVKGRGEPLKGLLGVESS